MKIEEAFFKACEEGNIERLDFLIPQIQNINMKSEEGWTGLVKTVYKEYIEAAKLLVAKGADVNATNNKATTIFMYAKTPVFTSKKTDLLAWLLEEGAEINAKDKAGLTVLDYVKLKDATWLQNWLIKQGAKFSHEI